MDKWKKGWNREMEKRGNGRMAWNREIINGRMAWNRETEDKWKKGVEQRNG